MGGLKGLSNGHLLGCLEEANHDVFVTVDQGIPHQQNFEQRRVDTMLAVISRIKPGEIVMIP